MDININITGQKGEESGTLSSFLPREVGGGESIQFTLSFPAWFMSLCMIHPGG